MLRWLRRLLLGRPHPRPGFRYECLSDGWWLCRICQRRVMDVQMGFHSANRKDSICQESSLPDA